MYILYTHFFIHSSVNGHQGFSHFVSLRCFLKLLGKNPVPFTKCQKIASGNHSHTIEGSSGKQRPTQKQGMANKIADVFVDYLNPTELS